MLNITPSTQSPTAWARSRLAVGAGSSLVGFLQGGAGAELRTLQSKVREWVSISDFGVTGNLAVDETAKVEAAVDYALSTSGHLLIDSNVRLSEMVIDGANGLTIWQKGLIVGLTSGTYNSVATIKNSSDVTWINPRISAQYNADYGSGIALYTDDASQCTNITLISPAISGALIAYDVGKLSIPDALVSEISIVGGFTYGCPNGLRALGTQCFVNLIGSQLLVNSLGGDAAWQAIVQNALLCYGANVVVNGGEVQHNQTAGGATFLLEPIIDAVYGHNYGSVFVVGAAIESASKLCIAQNTVGATPVAGSGVLSLQSCFGYHSADAFPFVDLASTFTGKIAVGGGSKFYCGTPRTQPTVIAAGDAQLFVDEDAFATNFQPGLKGLNGGTAHYSKRQILRASNTSSQTLAAGVAETLVFTSISAADDVARFAGDYSTSTGVFTLTQDMDSVGVSCSVRTSDPTAQLEVDVYVNGAFVASFNKMMGGVGNSGILTGRVDVGDLQSGDTVELKATCSASVTCNYGAYEFISIESKK